MASDKSISSTGKIQAEIKTASFANRIPIGSCLIDWK